MGSSTVILLILLPLTTFAMGPCGYNYNVLPSVGGCRGGWPRGYSQYGGIQYPPQGVRYISPYGQYGQGPYAQPNTGGGYVTAPPQILVPAGTHPTQSTPIERTHMVATTDQATTTDELADIFDEFKGRDEEYLGRLRSDTGTLTQDSSIFLQPLQPPSKSTPYKPTLSTSESNDALPETSKSLVSETTVTESKSGFIPQSKPLPAIYTEDKNPFPDPLQTTTTETKTLSIATPVSPSISHGSYAVAPRPLPPTTPYVRPYPFGPHNIPRPLVSPYGGYHPQPQPTIVQPSIPRALPPCSPSPGHAPTYTRIGGGAGPAGYVVEPAPAPVIYGGHRNLPPFIDCCGKCRSPCRSRVKRQLAAKLFDVSGKKIDIPPTKDGRCTSEELRETMMKSTTSTPTLSKRMIQKAAEEQFGGYFSVFCSKEDFSYSSRASFYCQTSKNDVVCFAFKHN